jgi:hypothetical protein
MGLFKKKTDPISDRSRALNGQIASLEAKIKKLNEQLEEKPGWRPRSASPGAGRTPDPARKPPRSANGEPVFEQVDQNRLTAPAEAPVTAQHFNELGVRKYDLFAVFHRFRKQFHGPPAANPKLINYLAAGSIQGLRPLRYEKRVARNRFLLLTVVFVLVLLGIFYGLVRRH